MNIRYVNYYITENGSYLNCDKHIITANKFIELDKDLKNVNEKFFDINFEDRRYIGIEDVRIFYNSNESNKLKFIGTGYHKNNSIGIVEGEYNLNNSILESRELNCAFNNSNCEKNWVYTDYNGTTHIIYKWNPLQICKVDEETNKLNLIESKDMPKIFSHIRGSSCGFNYVKKTSLSGININDNKNDNISITINETEIWFVLHIVSYESPRHYYHIIAIFDEKMNLLRYSAPFKFEGECIEYCLSIVVEDERVLINYSGWDRTTRIGIYDKTYIDSLVKYN